ncbi:MAG: hypothetical protein IJ586_01915, partial [Alloprevotella sp.]|nr:hypothetical protein [Alloprevotella sp.]
MAKKIELLISCVAKLNRDVQYASRTGHIVGILPRTTPRFARRGTRLSMVWYASRTICPILPKLSKHNKHMNV